jgi:hypothetical protein
LLDSAEATIDEAATKVTTRELYHELRPPCEPQAHIYCRMENMNGNNHPIDEIKCLLPAGSGHCTLCYLLAEENNQFACFYLDNTLSLINIG